MTMVPRDMVRFRTRPFAPQDYYTHAGVAWAVGPATA